MKELTRTENNVIRYFHVLSQCIKGWQGNNGEFFINFLDSFFYCLHKLRWYHRQISYEVSTITCEEGKSCLSTFTVFLFRAS